MIRWLRLQWHRFTLGRTARRILYLHGGIPVDYRFDPPKGTVAQLARGLDEAARKWSPASVDFSVVMRQALDVGPSRIRIVIEVVK